MRAEKKQKRHGLDLLPASQRQIVPAQRPLGLGLAGVPVDREIVQPATSYERVKLECWRRDVMCFFYRIPGFTQTQGPLIRCDFWLLSCRVLSYFPMLSPTHTTTNNTT